VASPVAGGRIRSRRCVARLGAAWLGVAGSGRWGRRRAVHKGEGGAGGGGAAAPAVVGTRALWATGGEVGIHDRGCQSRHRWSLTASTYGGVTRAAESSPAPRVARSDGAMTDAAVQLLFAAGVSLPL
jgi:hypothetical protein